MRPVRGGEHGQSTTEYAVVLMAFLSMVVAIAAVWHAAEDGRLLSIARDASSHNASGGATPGLVEDLLAY